MLAWLQKGTKRLRVPEPDTSIEVQVQPETSGTIHELQTNVNIDVSGTASVKDNLFYNKEFLTCGSFLKITNWTANHVAAPVTCCPDREGTEAVKRMEGMFNSSLWYRQGKAIAVTAQKIERPQRFESTH